MNDSEDCPEVWGRLHATGGAVVDGAGAEVGGAEPAGGVVTPVVAGRLVVRDDELLQPVETNATIEMSAPVRASSRLGVFAIL